MATPKLRALDLYKRLPRTNCGDCAVPSCLAFAALVASGQKAAADCPHLEPSSVESLVGERRPSPRQVAEAALAEQAARNRERLAEVDFAATAARLGLPLQGGRLVLRCLGKRFELDAAGDLHSDVHVNRWVHGPILDLVLDGKGLVPIGEWVTFPELRHTRDWVRFFDARCQERLREIADADPEFFFTVTSVLGARPLTSAERAGDRYAERGFVLTPLPRVPLLVSYWPGTEGFPSTLTLFFDRTAEENASAPALYQIVGGIVEMLARMAVTHGVR